MKCLLRIKILYFQFNEYFSNYSYLYQLVQYKQKNTISLYSQRYTQQQSLKYRQFTISLQIKTYTMNLMKKDKYITKIIEHLLHQFQKEQTQENTKNNFTKNHFDGLSQIKQQCQNIYTSAIFTKASKSKALIPDLEDTQRKNKRKVINEQFSNIGKQINKQKTSRSTNQEYKTLQSGIYNDKQNVKFNHIEPRGHMTKQKLFYHQQLPIMAVSQQFSQNIVEKYKYAKQKQEQQSKKIKKYSGNQNINDLNVKRKSSFNEGNEVKCQLSQVKNSELKEKKYKFITADKVSEALKSKRQFSQVKQNQNKQIIQSKQEEDNKNNEQNLHMNSTQRSKGSTQMLQFLQSARQKLFLNGKNSQLIYQTDHNMFTPEQSNNHHQKSQKNKKYQQITLKQNQQPLFNFKIQIQLSPNKTRQIQLNLTSNPNFIAKKFIQQNRQQLQKFKGLKQKKLTDLLSNKISSEIQKQRNQILQRKENKEELVEEKYRKIINHLGAGNQILFNDEDNQQMINDKKLNKVKRQGVDSKKQKIKQKLHKKEQFQHVYIENIDSMPNNIGQQLQVSIKKKNLNKKEKCPQQISQSKEIESDTLYPINKQQQLQSEMLESQENCINENYMKGYLNSPHELITYRQDTISASSQTDNKSPQIQNQQFNMFTQTISHFPLSKSTAQFKSIKKHTNQTIQKEVIQKQEQNNFDKHKQSDFGASKILSKSRNKLNKLKKQISREKQQFGNYKQENNNEQKQIADQRDNLQKKEQKLSIQKVKKSNNFNTINSISEQIITRLGKDKILSNLKQRQNSKKQQIINQKEIKQKLLMKQCSFKPKINHLSKTIDQNKNNKMKVGEILQIEEITTNNQRNNDSQNKTNSKQKIQSHDSFGFSYSKSKYEQQQKNNLKQHSNTKNILSHLQNSLQKSYQKNRHQNLYENHKTIEAKKSYNRQKSIEELSFKPQINKISKKIIQTKRNSLNNSTCQQFVNQNSASLYHSTCKKEKSKRNSVQFNNYNIYEQNPKNLHNKRKSLNFSRNLQGLQIGQYLYKQAMRVKKKKQSIVKSTSQNFKPLQKSQKIMNNLKKKRLAEYFYQLLNMEEYIESQQVLLSPQDIDFNDEKFFCYPMKYLVPLLQELKQLKVSLTKEQFIQSGLKLINYLSQDQKSEFLCKKMKPQNQDNKQNNHLIMNNFYQQIVSKKQYYLQDIYHRGLLYKKQTKDRIELNMEDKVRKQLQKCTFKPKVNSNYQTIQ